MEHFIVKLGINAKFWSLGVFVKYENIEKQWPLGRSQS